MRVITDEGSWITPPGQACWVPSEANHLVTFTQSSEFRTISIRADLLTDLPKKCCVIKLSPLLRELILTAIKIGWDYRLESYEARLMQLLIEKISLEKETPFFIPEGRDSRLKRVTSAMHENVRIDYTLNHWSNIAGASPRTLARLFELEMGMSFSTWRQQLCLLRAIEMLLKGQSITATAFMLGYSSAGNFTSMFTQAMSKSPSAYQHVSRNFRFDRSFMVFFTLLLAVVVLSSLNLFSAISSASGKSKQLNLLDPHFYFVRDPTAYHMGPIHIANE